MKTMILMALIIGAPFLLIIIIYNGLIRKKNEVQNAFGGMDTQLKKRYDLIPNLVAVVQEYASHEKETLERVTSMRAKVLSPEVSSEEKVKIENQMASDLGRLLVTVENYPDLKADSNFLNLQKSLNEVESQISASRRTYNAVITEYNNAIQTFPNNIMAGMMNLQPKEVFEIPDVQRENIDVKKLFNS